MATLSAKQIKFIKSLSQKKFRDEYGLFIAEGEKIVSEAISSNFVIKDIFKEDEIGKECMSRISSLSSPSPILAVIEKPNYSVNEILENLSGSKNSNDLFLALDGVKDPGNLGTIIRLADWFGINSIFASNGTVEVYNPKVVQATMGAIFRKKIFYVNLKDVVEQFVKASLPVYGTFLDGENLYKKQIEKRGLIVMGSESFGISKEIEQLINNKLLIPPFPETAQTSESLNVAIATAIICAEFRK